MPARCEQTTLQPVAQQQGRRCAPRQLGIVQLHGPPRTSSRWPMLICTLPWSLAVISLLVHELQRHTKQTEQRG